MHQQSTTTTVSETTDEIRMTDHCKTRMTDRHTSGGQQIPKWRRTNTKMAYLDSEKKKKRKRNEAPIHLEVGQEKKELNSFNLEK